MSKEAMLAVVCVLGALVLAVAAFARGGAGAPDGAEGRAVFAGGGQGPSATGGSASARRSGSASARRSGSATAGGPGPAGATVVSLRPGRVLALYDRPGGRALAQVAARTPFGSRTTLAVVRRRPGWLGVLSSDRPNGRVAWIRDDPGALERARVLQRLLIDRSERRLTLVRGKRAVLSVQVGVGRPGSETPTGTFAVTDKLDGHRFTSAYGCCILALTGRQTRLPPGWRGGDRLALHGTSGAAARSGSAGCVTVDEAPLRRLMQRVPLGTLVTIRP